MRRLAVVAALAVALAAGCGGGSDERSSPAPTEAVVRTIAADELSAHGSLRTCVDLGSPPFAYSVRGKETGFEVELLGRIARRLGLRVVWVPTPRTHFAEALAGGTCDVIVSRLGYDLDTQFHLNVGALQYLALPLVLAVPGGSTTAPVTMAGLCGRKLAVVAWTAPAFLAREEQDACRKAGAPALTLTKAPTSEQALALVRGGRAEAAFDDAFSTRALLRDRDGYDTVEVTDRKGYIALGYRKPGLSTEAGLHASLLALYDDGVVRRLIAQWRLGDATLLPLP